MSNVRLPIFEMRWLTIHDVWIDICTIALRLVKEEGIWQQVSVEIFPCIDSKGR